MIYIKIKPATLIQFTKYWKGKRRQHYKKKQTLEFDRRKKFFLALLIEILKTPLYFYSFIFKCPSSTNRLINYFFLLNMPKTRNVL